MPQSSNVKRTRPPGPEPAGRFQEFWDKYPRQFDEDSACRDWCTYVTEDVEAAVFACLERYLLSRDVASGAIRNAGGMQRDIGWIAICARDKWKSTWPVAKAKEEKTIWK